MLSTPYALTLNGRPAVGARVRGATPAMVRRDDNWSAVRTACTDAIFTKMAHGRRPEEEAS